MERMLVSDLLKGAPWTIDRVAFDHVVHWIKHPDPNSKFEQATQYVRWLPAWVLIGMLLLFKYNGIIFFDEERRLLLGHTFFQKRGSALHLFSIFVCPEYQGNGLGTSITREFLVHVWDTGIRRARLGAGGHQAVQKLWQKADCFDLPFTVIAEEPENSNSEQGWVRLQAA